MKSIKCPQCGFQNWETAEWCQQCKFVFKTAAVNPPNSKSAAADFGGSQTAGNPPSFGSSANQTAGESAASGFVAKEGFLAKNIERCNRNLMIVCLAVIVSTTVFALYNARYVANVILGPAAIEPDKLLFGNQDLPDDTFRNYVKVSAEDVYDTGSNYYEVDDHNVKTIKSQYFMLDMQGKLLLTELGADTDLTDGAKNVEVSGELADISAAESTNVTEPLLRDHPELRSDLLPFILRAKSGYGTAAYIGAAVVFGLLLIAGYFLWTVLKRIGSPESSETMKSLAAHGSPAQVAASVDAEHAKSHERVGSIYLLPTWIIQNGTFSVEARHVEDIVWMYKKVTKHSVNFIPTGKTYELILHDTQGKTLSLRGRGLKDQSTDQLIDKIYRRIPWVITGFTNEALTEWNKNKANFIETVKARKQSYADHLKQNAPAV